MRSRLYDAEREYRLAKKDIDNPRPEFWEADLLRFKFAERELRDAKSQQSNN